MAAPRKKASKKKTKSKPKAKVGKGNKGAPSLFTEECRQKIYDNLHKCPFYTVAAENAGITRQTLNNWLNQGIADDEAGLKTEFATFFYRVRQLRSQAEIDLFTTVKTEASKNWLAARYVLQCMNGKLYGQKAALRIEDADTEDSAFDGDNIHAKLVGLVSKIEADE